MGSPPAGAIPSDAILDPRIYRVWALAALAPGLPERRSSPFPRSVFLLAARTLRARAVSDRLAALEFARREARADLHRSAEAAALAGVEIGGPAALSVMERAPARAREVTPPPAPPAAPPLSPEEGEPWHVRLRLWKESEGLTQAQAAERLRTGKSTWSTWERPGAAPLSRLSAPTGIPASAFLEVSRA